MILGIVLKLLAKNQLFQIGLPFLSTLPTTLPGLPTTKENGSTSLVTTAPDSIKAYSPIVTPHIIVAFAPILADFLLMSWNSTLILSVEFRPWV